MDQYLQGIACDGAYINVYNCRPVIGDYLGGYWPCMARENVAIQFDYSAGDHGTTEDLSSVFPAASPEGPNGHNVSFVVVVVMPYRDVNNVQRIMQEHCTFGVVTPDIYTPAA